MSSNWQVEAKVIFPVLETGSASDAMIAIGDKIRQLDILGAQIVEMGVRRVKPEELEVK